MAEWLAVAEGRMYLYFFAMFFSIYGFNDTVVEVVLCSLGYAYGYGYGYGSQRMTPSKATRAMAFAGNARRKQGTKPRKYPLHPRSL